MVYTIITLILFLAIIAIGIASWINGNKQYYETRRQEVRKGKGNITLGIVMVITGAILFLIIPFSFHQVETGQLAVVKEMGKVNGTRDAGVHFDFWMTKSYDIYDTKVRSVNATTMAYSNDKQTMDVEMTVQYQIDKSAVEDIAITYGSLGALESRINAVVIERTKSVLSQKTASSIISERSSVSAEVAQVVEDAIGAQYHIDVTNVSLTNIDFSDAFEQSVEQSMIAQQEVEKAKAEAEKAKAQAEGELEVAKLQAQAEVARAEAAAQAIIVKAQAEAQALNIQTLEVARMFGFTEFVIKLDENGQKIQATNEQGELLYINGLGEYTTEAKTDSVDNTIAYVMIEQIKELDPADAKLIADYIEYIKYLETWDGKLPEVITDGSGIIINP